MFHNVTTDGPPPRVPSFRGVRRSRGVCIRNQIPKVLISGIHIRAGSASGIHTPPLPWHPFQKGTLPPCRLHPHTASIARDRRPATASPLFLMGTAKPGGMYPKTYSKSPYSWSNRRTATASPLSQRGTAKPGGMYPKSNTKSPYREYR